jgi:hypothetical protein
VDEIHQIFRVKNALNISRALTAYVFKSFHSFTKLSYTHERRFSFTNLTEYDIHFMPGTGNLTTVHIYAPPIDIVTPIMSSRFQRRTDNAKFCLFVFSIFSIRLFVQVVPLLMWSYVIHLVFMVFLPIMGRNGTAANPDITIGKSCAAGPSADVELRDPGGLHGLPPHHGQERHCCQPRYNHW